MHPPLMPACFQAANGMSNRRGRRHLAGTQMVGLCLFALCLAGCASPGINQARKQFYAGQLTEANAALAESDTGGGKDRVLVLMERGMIHHTAGEHAAATRDWLDAAGHIRQLDYVRLSEKTASMVINDRTETYTGRPYERALLHAFTAKSYFALGLLREAAVEARLIVDGFENLNGFPDDAYTRYIAGLAFEMIRDFNGSRIEYTQADKLTPAIHIDPASGRIAPAGDSVRQPSSATGGHELVCLITIGRTPAYPAQSANAFNTGWGLYPYAEIRQNGTPLGRSYTLNTTGNLATLTQKRIAAIKAAKTVTRIVIKDSIADAVAENNPLLGEVMRLLLFALEMPDTRQWQTLPHWLQVARVPYSPENGSLEIVFRNASGRILRRTPLAAPPVRGDNKHIAILRVW